MELALKSFSNDAPSGPNFEYEAVFAALEMAAQPGEERQSGTEIIEAEPPDYGDVMAKALAVLEQSHDLRAAIHLARAALHKDGFAGFALVTTYVRGCLEIFWDSCHPQLDAEEDNDPTMRVNAVLGLSDNDMVNMLRNAPLTRSNAFGMARLRDLDIVSGEISAVDDRDNMFNDNKLSAAFQDTPDDVLKEILDAARTALGDLKAVDAVFDTRIPGLGPNLEPAQKMLHRVVTRLADEAGGQAEPEGEAAEEAGGDGMKTAGTDAPLAASLGALSSPKDVDAALDRILKYYTQYEPSSPLPLLLKRAKRLVGADFLTIIKDIAPGGMDNVTLLGGVSDEEA